jgi:uncharacterized protein DUF3309
MTIVFIILAVLLLLAALPTWPYSAGWGYYPAGGFSAADRAFDICRGVGWI